MKKFLFSIISLGLLGGLSSCSNNDSKFYVFGAGYGVQLGDNQFRPIVTFDANSVFSKELSKLTKDGGSVQAQYTDKYLIETIGMYADLTEMAGVYNLEAVSIEGKEFDTNVTLSFDKTIGELHFDDFEYNGRELKMKVSEQVENATHYGFYYRPISQSSVVNTWAFNGFVNSTYTHSTGQAGQNITQFYYSSNMPYEAIMIYPVAIRRSEKSLLIRLDANQGRVIKKEANSFED